MSKILSYYLKRDKWILLAMALIPALASLVLMTELGPVINFLAVYLVILVGSLWIMVRDYKRFYGEYSSFFSGLPLTGGEIIGARFWWFIATGLYGFVIIGLKGLEFVLRIARHTPNFNELSITVQNVFNQTGSRIFVYFTAGFIVTMIFSTAIWLFITSIGSEKFLRRFGIGGPVIVYIGVGVVTNILMGIVSRFSYAKIVIDANASQEMMAKLLMERFDRGAALMAVLFLVLSVAMIARSIYSHDRKLSTF